MQELRWDGEAIAAIPILSEIWLHIPKICRIAPSPPTILCMNVYDWQNYTATALNLSKSRNSINVYKRLRFCPGAIEELPRNALSFLFSLLLLIRLRLLPSKGEQLLRWWWRMEILRNVVAGLTGLRQSHWGAQTQQANWFKEQPASTMRKRLQATILMSCHLVGLSKFAQNSNNPRKIRAKDTRGSTRFKFICTINRDTSRCSE